MKQLDLGSANALRGEPDYEVYGVDIVASPDPRIVQCDLVIDKLPFKSDMFDIVTAHDILEHIPGVLYVPDVITFRPKRIQPIIELFNEVYRVLKHNGLFKIWVPEDDYTDTTHVSRWCQETFNHLSGDYYGFHDHYGHTSRFERIEINQGADNRIHATLRAIKTLPVDAEYKLNYGEVK